jgi:transposase
MTDPRTLKFKPWQRHKLLQLRDHDPRPYVRERAAAILKIAAGDAPHAVAQHGLLKRRDPDTVYHWRDLFEAEGVEGLCQHQHGGNRRTSSLDAQRAELEERLRQAPDGTAASTAPIPHRTPLPPSRWSLIVVRQHFDWLADYSLSGVWRVLQRCEIEWKHGYVNHWSPDPDYTRKVRRIEKCLKQAVSDPQHVVALFLDEMGYYRWPGAARDWLPTEDGYPRAEHGDCTNQQWRVIGALNARTGQVSYLQNYIIGRAKVIEFYALLNRQYEQVDQVYVIRDNWNVHTHPEVQAALAALPRLVMVPLPTYAPWLNPIEKLWRWVRQRILHHHRLSERWNELKQRVAQFFDQFAAGSEELLKYVGLRGKGRWAKILRRHYPT